MTPREVAAQTTAMVLKELNIDRKDWRKLLDIPVSDFLRLQAELPSKVPRPLQPTGKRTDGSSPEVSHLWLMELLPDHPFDPVAPAISMINPSRRMERRRVYVLWYGIE
jgi:para-nitrobenzyl esterase